MDKNRTGRGGPIRTGDHLNPIQVRYQAALRPDNRHYTKIAVVWQGVRIPSPAGQVSLDRIGASIIWFSVGTAIG